MIPTSPPHCTEAEQNIQDLSCPYADVKTQALDYAYLLIGDIDRARRLLRETRELIQHSYPGLPRDHTVPGLLRKWLRVRHLHEMRGDAGGVIHASTTPKSQK